jgi:hypothetical protein
MYLIGTPALDSFPVPLKEIAMKMALSLLLPLFLTTSAFADNTCRCVTAECAAGLQPSYPHKVSYEESCMVLGTVVCSLAAFKTKDYKKAFATCQVGKVGFCIKMCK